MNKQKESYKKTMGKLGQNPCQEENLYSGKSLMLRPYGSKQKEGIKSHQKDRVLSTAKLAMHAVYTMIVFLINASSFKSWC